MPYKIFRYILLKFNTTFVVALLVFSSLFLMDQASRQVERLASLAQGLGDFVISFFLLAPHLLAYTVPLAFLLAMIWTLEQMKMERELTAIMATGISPLTLFLPFHAVSVVVAVLVFMITNFAGPASFQKYDKRLGQMARRNVLSELKPGTFFTGIPGVVLLVGGFDGKSGEMDGLLMVSRGDEEGSGEMITARKGIVEPDPEGMGEIRLKLGDGAIHPLAAAEPGYSSGTFHSMASVIHTESGTDEVDSKRVLMAESNHRLRELLKDQKDKENPAETVDLVLELNRRLALPLAVLFYPLIIFPLAVSAGRQGKALAFSGSLLLFLATFLIDSLGSSLAHENLISPVLGAWLSDLLLATGGMVLFAAFALRLGLPGTRGSERVS